MNERNGMTRRTWLSTTAAAGAVGVASVRMAQAQPADGLARTDGEYLIRDAYVLSMEPAIGNLPHGDIHVRDGAIVAVGTNVTAPTAQVIDGKTLIACPGFIETHWHMWGAVARNMA